MPAVYVVFLRPVAPGHEVLLQLRRGTGFMDEHWACAAAGHLERGESLAQAARREAHEELGVGLSALTPLCALQRTGATGAPVDERVDFFVRADAWSGEPRIREPDKCADLRWFALETLPDPVVPHERLVLEGIRGGDLPSLVSVGF